MCVLGAINEHYEAVCDVCMYVCMCLKLFVNYRQTIGFFLLYPTAVPTIRPDNKNHIKGEKGKG